MEGFLHFSLYPSFSFSLLLLWSLLEGMPSWSLGRVCTECQVQTHVVNEQGWRLHVCCTHWGCFCPGWLHGWTVVPGAAPFASWVWLLNPTVRRDGPASMQWSVLVGFSWDRFIFHLMPLPNVIQYFLVGWLACLECLCAIFCGVLIATVVKRFPLRRSSIFRWSAEKRGRLWQQEKNGRDFRHNGC